LLKRLAARIKSIFGKKPKQTQQVPVTSAREAIPARTQRKPFPKKEPAGTHHPREQRKRETREEYAARHAKRPQQQPTPAATPLEQERWDHSEFKVPVVDGKTRFHDFQLPDGLMHAIHDLKFQYCTPVQAETLAKSLTGEDVTVQAQTGTGKTAAFLISIFTHFVKHPEEGKRQRGTPRDRKSVV
jgi:ATP-dependent RNA helicase RhlB